MVQPSHDVKDLGATAPLEAGHVRWEGMVRPTEGGLDVRGVTLPRAALVEKLQASPHDGTPADPDWFLGAVVRVTGALRQPTSEGPDGGPTSPGARLVAARLDTVELVRAAEQIEGIIHRSKGMWSLDRYLLDRHDLEQALLSGGDGKVGTHVRVWGQSHVYRCDPREQCLVGGSMPIFVVARARVIP